MSIHSTKQPSVFEYSLNKHILKKVQDNPYLGVQISSNFKWADHVNKVSSKANGIMGFIRRNLRHSKTEDNS